MSAPSADMLCGRPSSCRASTVIAFRLGIATYSGVPSLIPARWLGQNSGPIFRRLWINVHRIKFACAGVSVVCNAVFRLTMSC